jgi:hypothetical protein
MSRLGKYIYVTEWPEEENTSNAQKSCTMRFIQGAHSGFFDFGDYIDATPGNAQPISCQFIDSDKIWTKKPFIQHTHTVEILPPGELVHDVMARFTLTIKS